MTQTVPPGNPEAPTTPEATTPERGADGGHAAVRALPAALRRRRLPHAVVQQAGRRKWTVHPPSKRPCGRVRRALAPVVDLPLRPPGTA